MKVPSWKQYACRKGQDAEKIEQCSENPSREVGDVRVPFNRCLSRSKSPWMMRKNLNPSLTLSLMMMSLTRSRKSQS
jgi:hypothetical protein